MEELLGLSEEALLPDPRIGDDIDSTVKVPSHEFARYIKNNIVLPTGFLIDELTLAARLGVDVSKSEDWTKVLDALSTSKYTGVFCDAWPRWWMQTVRDWWTNELEIPAVLEKIEAEERVSLLKEKLGITGLQVPQSSKGEQTRYWHVCKAEGRPIDPLDAVQIKSQFQPIWSEGEYISLNAALERKHRELDLHIHPLERDRVRAASRGS